jgi:hypothetical protein
MPDPASPFEVNPPTTRRLISSVAAAVGGAIIILIALVLPAEYNIDPLGIGRVLGLTAIHGAKRTLQVKDVIGGNDGYRQAAISDPRKPVPLPNPAVIQVKRGAARVEHIAVRLEPGEETEIKAIMDAAQVILYSWRAEGGEVYTDFHGHEPDAGDAFVRYEEQMSGKEGHGSLVAPFSGEHGWYWVNVSDQPVTITLDFSGYHHEVKNYGLLHR